MGQLHIVCREYVRFLMALVQWCSGSVSSLVAPLPMFSSSPSAGEVRGSNPSCGAVAYGQELVALRLRGR